MVYFWKLLKSPDQPTWMHKHLHHQHPLDPPALESGLDPPVFFVSAVSVRPRNAGLVRHFEIAVECAFEIFSVILRVYDTKTTFHFTSLQREIQHCVLRPLNFKIFDSKNLWLLDNWTVVNYKAPSYNDLYPLSPTLFSARLTFNFDVMRPPHHLISWQPCLAGHTWV